MEYVNSSPKTNFFRKAVGLSAVLLLAACADAPLLNDLTGEPPPGAMANRAGILRVDSREAVWPNLASVPPRPTDVSSLTARQHELNALTTARDDGLQILRARQAATPSAP